ncbi:hypothetical protein UPYG_G00145640 [Umbra pygmaea]|uniref:Uncharacterized protein n=1 Tax=Umbra pygmaea TaxID=75934 RepID=A0ABD0WW72_UMBPY
MPWLWRLFGQLSQVKWSLCLMPLLMVPIAFIICTKCSKRKKTSSLSLVEPGEISGEKPPNESIEVTTSEPVTTINVPVSSKLKSSESKRAHRVSYPAHVTPKSLKKNVRQLPPVPEQNKSNVRRHSSYTESAVYDIVGVDVRNPWPILDKNAPVQQTTDGINHIGEIFEEDKEGSFPVYATVIKNKFRSKSSKHSPMNF